MTADQEMEHLARQLFAEFSAGEMADMRAVAQGMDTMQLVIITDILSDEQSAQILLRLARLMFAAERASRPRPPEPVLALVPDEPS